MTQTKSCENRVPQNTCRPVASLGNYWNARQNARAAQERPSPVISQ